MAAIFVVGFMGSGKTTVGRALARRLAWRFLDLDQVIEAEQGRSIPAIFEQEGEAAFRRLESEALQNQLAAAREGADVVIALGGGAFAQEANRVLLGGENTIWLDCDFARAQARVARDTGRPNARDPERFARLYAERRPAYAQARHRVQIESDDPQHAVTAILTLVGRPQN